MASSTNSQLSAYDRISGTHRFPAALQLAGDDLGAPTILRLLERWPTAQELGAATRAEPVGFARQATTAGPIGWPTASWPR
jgi:hypothetical protein